MDQAMSGRWRERAAMLAGGDATATEWLLRETRLLSLRAGSEAFAPGTPCSAYIIVIEGSLRVQLVSETGRQILLYRVSSGESCVLTTSCLLSNEDYGAEAIVETDAVVAALPASTFRELLALSEPFRSFVLASYADRVSDLIITMEETVFQRIERRLAAALLARAEGDRVQATHEELAAELGTAREVVSRQLKVFGQRGLVSRQRGQVTIVDRSRLEKLAAP